jgi:hypothetical protein
MTPALMWRYIPNITNILPLRRTSCNEQNKMNESGLTMPDVEMDLLQLEPRRGKSIRFHIQRNLGRSHYMRVCGGGGIGSHGRVVYFNRSGCLRVGGDEEQGYEHEHCSVHKGGLNLKFRGLLTEFVVSDGYW